jgi:hypothetical protein
LLKEGLNHISTLLPLVGLGLGEQEISFELLHLEQLCLLFGHLLSIGLLLLLLLCDDPVELVDGLSRLCGFGVAVQDVGVDLGFCSSPLAANL